MLVSCVNHGSTDKGLSLNNANDSAAVQIKNTIDAKYIEGVWAKNEKENALFEIKGDSIFYVEHPDNPVTYKIANDTFIIFYEGLTTRNRIIKLDADSFVFKTETDYINRLYRRKE